MMCNATPIVLNIKNLFQCLFLFSIIKIIHSKSIRKYDECDLFYNLTDCYYFPCLDAHYSCGRDNHLARFSYDLCLLTTKKYSSQLTINAKFYFNHTNQCAMASLHDQLIEEKISSKFSCSHLQTLIFNIYLNCFQNNQRENKMIKIIDFCSIICENLQTIIDLFLNLNNNYINLQRLIRQTGKTCGADVNESIVHTVPSLLMAICLDRKDVHLKQDITNIMFNSRFEPSDYDWI
jgi:hypothetical protein